VAALLPPVPNRAREFAMSARSPLTTLCACLLAALFLIGLGSLADAEAASKKAKTTATQEAPPKPAWPSWLAESAESALAYLERLKGMSDKADAVTLAERRVSARELFESQNLWDARSTLERILADAPDDLTAWALLGQSFTYRGEEEDGIRLAAAYHVWRLAGTDLDRAIALWVGREVAPDPVEAEQAALALADRARITARLDELRQNYPAEFIPLRVEGQANATSGSACVAFTHPLLRPRISRYDDYVEVTPRFPDLAVVASGRRLCVDGVPFGETATLGLRAGLPGIGERRTLEAASFDVVIPHRAASLRFRETGYVLPSRGPQVVPLESVNTEAARVRVLRIVERNLLAALRSDFPNQQREWQVSNLAYGDAEQIFDGTVTLGGALDRTVTTGLPVNELTGGPLEPGVYLVAAGPAGKADEYGGIPVETSQWLLVSDIGLNLMQGPDGLHVFTRSLSTANPLENVEVALVATSNRILATARSDAAGHVRFDKPLTQGGGGAAPLLVRAEAPTLGFTFLPFAQAAFDLSDRGIAGRDDPGPVDSFVFVERGVYRPGETVHATTLLRDASGAALSGIPLTLRLERPDGIEANRVTLSDAGAGGYSADLAIAANSMTGQWTLLAHLDPAAPAIGRTTFLVEDFVPPTIEVSATAAEALATPSAPLTVTVAADYLFGAPAGDLRVDAKALLRTAETPYPALSGYRFGLIEEPWNARYVSLGSARTGADGKAPITGALGVVPDTTQALEAEITVSVFEVSGRAVSTRVVVPYSHQAVQLGMKPGFADDSVADGSPAGFEVVAVGPDGTLLERAGVSYTLYREDWRYIWFKRYDSWDYEVAVSDTPVARGSLELKAATPTPLSFDAVNWGRYRLEVVDQATGAATSMRFTAGWWVAPGAEGRPDMVTLTLDKAGYGMGEVAQVHVEAPYAGQLVLLRAGATLEIVHSGPIDTAGITVPVTVDADWLDGPGAYLLAAVYRPGQDLAVAMPARALGVAWLAADKARRDIALNLTTPALMRPNASLAVTLKAPNIGRSAYAVVAAVDDAVLGLTGYQTPDPLAHVMAQRRLAFELRDSYGRLIDPRDAPRGVLKTGGDGVSELDTSLAVRSTRVVSLFSGIVSFDANGEASVSLAVPDFAGRLRVMAVAWNSDRLGHAEADVTVSDPLVATLSLPRFLAPKDQATTFLSIENVDATPGDYSVALSASGPLEAVLGGGGKVKVESGKRSTVPVAIRGTGLGVGTMKLTLSGPDGLSIVRDYEIAVRPAVNRQRSSTFFSLAPNERFQIAGGLLDSFVAGSASATLALGAAPDFGAPALTSALFEYPYRCLEQSSSRGTGLMWGVKWHAEAAGEVAQAIERVVSLQRYDGSFGLWSSRADAEPWLSAHATEMLIRARIAGYQVPEVPYQNALAWIANQTAQPGEASYELSARAYAFYALSLSDRGDLGRLRYFAENYLDRLPGAIDSALIGAALARYGERDLAATAFAAALNGQRMPSPEDWYGSDIRELAALIALIAEAGVADDQLPALVDDLRSRVGPRSRYSTQEMAWIVRAAVTLESRGAGEAKALLGTTPQVFMGTFLHRLDEAEQISGLVVGNAGEKSLFGTLDVVGVPLATPLPTDQNGISIARQLLNLDGTEVAAPKLRQGDLVIVRLSGRTTDTRNHHLLLVDLLPAGLEIENPQLGGKDVLKEMPWLASLSVVDHASARDDRFVAALRVYGEAAFEVAYLARAVTPGVYAAPGPYVESMYRSEVYGIGAAGTLTVAR
jgi:uncharacterized protein YfaS (alpha-2-macroglobulin family)